MSETCELTIESLAFGGSGIARWEGEVVFIPGVLPGERVRVLMVDHRRSFCRARLLEILDAAPERIPPVCPFAVIPWSRPWATSPFCPGCTYQQMTYAAECDSKRRQLHDFLTHAVSEEIPIQVEGALEPMGYRNKGVLHAAVEPEECRLGYVQEDNHTVLDIPGCPLLHPDLNACLAELRGRPGFLKGFRDQARLTLRRTEPDGANWWRGSPKSSDPWLHETTLVGDLLVPRNAFFQVNLPVADRLFKWVQDRIRSSPCDTVVDLYCGVGIFGLIAAAEGRKVLGVESHGQAIDAARINTGRLGFDPARVAWQTGDAGRVWPALAATLDLKSCQVVIDPPRAGLDPELCRHLTERPVSSLLYVSCGPDTLARDLKRLTTGGYEIRSVALFDMFPRTPHFETAVELVS
jgi:23S rRNA (uracil1939-C5)-methyltransferase